MSDAGQSTRARPAATESSRAIAAAATKRAYIHKSTGQIRALEELFTKNQGYPTTAQQQDCARKLSLPFRTVVDWTKQRRRRMPPSVIAATASGPHKNAKELKWKPTKLPTLQPPETLAAPVVQPDTATTVTEVQTSHAGLADCVKEVVRMLEIMIAHDPFQRALVLRELARLLGPGDVSIIHLHAMERAGHAQPTFTLADLNAPEPDVHCDSDITDSRSLSSSSSEASPPSSSVSAYYDSPSQDEDDSSGALLPEYLDTD